MPKELNEDERREAASSFAERLTGGERLPYTLAIHRGGANGENPHAHLMFSERGNDGIERSGERPVRRGSRTANRAGDLKRAAELSREPNVHLGPERYRTSRGGASEPVQQAGRVERRNAVDRGERDADSRKVERLDHWPAASYDRFPVSVAQENADVPLEARQ